jgi:hypothetical protein
MIQQPLTTCAKQDSQYAICKHANAGIKAALSFFGVRG